MYLYYIRDDATGMYLIGRMKLGAPVPTCVWGERRSDAMTFDGPTEARKAILEIGVNIASVYRLNIRSGQEVRLKTGGDNERPTSGRAEGVRTDCAARNPWPGADVDRGRER